MGMHSRDPSLQSEGGSSVARSNLARANTTGGMPSGPGSTGSVSPGGRISPFQPIRGSIPTIPTAQLSTTADVVDVSGEDLQDRHSAVSVSDSESDVDRPRYD